MPTRPPVHRPAARPTPRPSAARRGYDAGWRRLRSIKLREDPLCAVCGRPAREVDHIDGDPWNRCWGNLQSLCKQHHSEKTCREQGAFGRPRQARPH